MRSRGRRLPVFSKGQTVRGGSAGEDCPLPSALWPLALLRCLRKGFQVINVCRGRKHQQNCTANRFHGSLLSGPPTLSLEAGRRRGGFSGSGCRLTLNFSWVAGPPLCPLCWGSSGQAPSAAAIPLSRSHPTPACQSLLRPRGPAPMGNLPGRLPHTGWPPPPPGSRHTLPSYINDILFFILLLLLLFMSVGMIARSSLF